MNVSDFKALHALLPLLAERQREFLGHESVIAKVLLPPPTTLLQPGNGMQAVTSSPSSAQGTGSIRRRAGLP